MTDNQKPKKSSDETLRKSSDEQVVSQFSNLSAETKKKIRVHVQEILAEELR
jgi:hypothetical protein